MTGCIHITTLPGEYIPFTNLNRTSQLILLQQKKLRYEKTSIISRDSLHLYYV